MSAQHSLFEGTPRLCRACARVKIVDARDADGGQQVLDAQAPVYRLTSPAGEPATAVRDLGAFVSHWSTCRAPEVQRRLGSGIVPPPTWYALVTELLEVLGAGDEVLPAEDWQVDAALELLTGYFGDTPPGAPMAD